MLASTKRGGYATREKRSHAARTANWAAAGYASRTKYSDLRRTASIAARMSAFALQLVSFNHTASSSFSFEDTDARLLQILEPQETSRCRVVQEVKKCSALARPQRAGPQNIILRQILGFRRCRSRISLIRSRNSRSFTGPVYGDDLVVSYDPARRDGLTNCLPILGLTLASPAIGLILFGRPVYLIHDRGGRRAR